MNLQVFEAKIFNPRKGIGFHLTSSRLYYGSLLLTLDFALLFKVIDYNSYQSFSAVFLILVVGGIIGAIWGTYSFEKKHGKLEGLLRVETSHLSIRRKNYSWNSISSISFNLGNIHGYDLEPGYRFRFRGGPRYSAGLDNFIEFKHDSKKIKVQFQLTSLLQKEKLEKIIRYQFYLDRIPLVQTYDGLHLTYEEIQQLKKDTGHYFEVNQEFAH